MFILGLLLLLAGWFFNIGLLTTIGWFVLVVGVILFVLGAMGRSVGGRRYWY